MLIATPSSPSGSDKRVDDLVPNGDSSPTAAQSTGMWSPFGKSGVGPMKTYKPVAFCPVSSSPPSLSSPVTAVSNDVSLKSSLTWSPSSSQPASSIATTMMVNGDVSEASEKVGPHGRNVGQSFAQPGSLLSSSSSGDAISKLSITFGGLVPPASSTPDLNSSATGSSSADWKPSAPLSSNWKPTVSSTDWKPSSSPSSLSTDQKPSTSFKDWKPVPSSTDWKASSSSSAAASSEWKPSVSSTTEWKPIPSSSTDLKPSPVPSSGWTPQVTSLYDRKPHESYLSSEESPSKTTHPSNVRDSDQNLTSITRKMEPIDTTIFDKELSEEWWNSVLNGAQNPDIDAIYAASLERDAEPVESPPLKDPSLSSTAAVLRLSSSLGDAIQNVPDLEPVNSQKQNFQSSPRSKASELLTNKPSDNDILKEWRSGFYDQDDHLTQQQYDHFKEIQEARVKSDHQKMSATEQLVNGIREETGKRKSEADETRELEEKLIANATRDPITPVPVKFEGIGPTDEKTGVPIATRVSIDEKNRKDWYRQMYASLHIPQKPPSSGKVRLDGDRSEQHVVIRSPSPPDGSTCSYYPPHAKYKPERYRNQPLRIEDYEPGHHSSIALKDPKTDESRFFESDAEVDYRRGDMDSLLEPDVKGKDQADKAGTRKKTNSTLSRSKSCSRQTARQKRDEENKKRKQEIEVVMAEERRRRFVEEQKQNEARRHKDLLTLMQKNTVLLNRFKDDEIGGMQLQRPKQVKTEKMNGTAKALYTFKAQTNKELSFKKGDIIYLHRQIDKNWFQGEHNGVVGIFPVAYVEVTTSLDEARMMALQREGKAIARFDFQAKSPAELTLQKGDIIMLMRKVDKNWYVGRSGNRQGIFPVAFVETVREPDTPTLTPSSSQNTTPQPDAPRRQSVASSVFSAGPDVPSAPVSPWNSDFYESELEPELQEMTLGTRRQRLPNKTRSDHIHQLPPIVDKGRATQAKPGSYFTLPSSQAKTQTKAPKSAPLTSEKAKESKPEATKDLFLLASQRRKANVGGALESRSVSLGDDLEKIVQHPLTAIDPLGKSLSFEFGRHKNPSKSASQFIVVYDYEPKNEDELELKEGEVVSVLEKCDDGWYVGFSEASGEHGTFPGNYVQHI